MRGTNFRVSEAKSQTGGLLSFWTRSSRILYSPLFVRTTPISSRLGGRSSWRFPSGLALSFAVTAEMPSVRMYSSSMASSRARFPVCLVSRYSTARS